MDSQVKKLGYKPIISKIQELITLVLLPIICNENVTNLSIKIL